MDTQARRTHDEWIALRCRLGEPGAFAELVRELERPLLYYAAKLLANEDAAFDVLQEVWLTAFRAIRRLEDARTVRSWLYRITHDRGHRPHPARPFPRPSRAHAGRVHAGGTR